MSADDHANTGSRARDHLANERTYLAWVRTALGGLALGIAVERFGTDGAGNAVHFYATLLVISAVVLLALATRRYFIVARDLDDGRFRVDRRSPYVILIGTGVLALLSLVLFVA
ncbi:MAG: YidH family protein [Acidimicrobiales bacterium]